MGDFRTDDRGGRTRRLSQQSHDAGHGALPPCGALGIEGRQMLGPVVGMPILRAAIRVKWPGPKKVWIDAVHDFRPMLNYCFQMP